MPPKQSDIQRKTAAVDIQHVQQDRKTARQTKHDQTYTLAQEKKQVAEQEQKDKKN